jgi:hypothetical protein
MRALISIIFLACSATLSAQNYDCLQFGPKNYFINGSGDVRGIRIDSIHTSGSDTIFYPYRTVRMSDYILGSTNIDSFGGSWLGKNVIKQADGTFLFDNIWDTLII